MVWRGQVLVERYGTAVKARSGNARCVMVRWGTVRQSRLGSSGLGGGAVCVGEVWSGSLG